MSRPQRGVIISDLHCGHRAGLTPPAWQWRPGDEDKYGNKQHKWAEQQAHIWKWYRAEIKSLGRIDWLICNGDAIEGKGPRSGGTELITSDRSEQIDMAGECLSIVNAKTIRLTRGTPAHTGQEEDWEDQLAKHLNCKIGDHEWFDCNGLIFDCKHKIGGSSIPHGRATPLIRAGLWNMLWKAGKLQPEADVLVRSHVHYCFDCQGLTPYKRYFITPAMQGFGSKFGAKECEGTVNVGFISFEITNQRKWKWHMHLLDLEFAAAKAEKL